MAMKNLFTRTFIFFAKDCILYITWTSPNHEYSSHSQHWADPHLFSVVVGYFWQYYDFSVSFSISSMALEACCLIQGWASTATRGSRLLGSFSKSCQNKAPPLAQCHIHIHAIYQTLLENSCSTQLTLLIRSLAPAEKWGGKTTWTCEDNHQIWHVTINKL